MDDELIGATLHTNHAGPLRLVAELAHGSEGAVLTTDQAGWLVKVYDPWVAPEESLPLLRRQKARAYRTFAHLRLERSPALAALPLEPVTAPGQRPGYLMRLAPGRLLSTALAEAKSHPLPLAERLALAHALAQAVERLHSSQIVHADLKPDNFMVEGLMRSRADAGRGEPRVYVLDIDGGGYRGPTHPGRLDVIVPSAVPSGLCAVPELAQSARWETLWPQPSLVFEPDLWGLAVLIYCILVDSDGPFPTRPRRALPPGLPAYDPYAPREWAGDSTWPKPWQAALMAAQPIASALMQGFRRVFDGPRDRVRGGRPRLPAAEWRKRLAALSRGAVLVSCREK